MKTGHKKISHRKFFDYVSEPGIVNLITGKRKAGKTATFVSVMQPAMEGTIKGYDHDVSVLTNVVFVRGGMPGRNMPPGMYYVDSVEQMFRTMLNIYEEKGTKARMIVGMDEAQQHMLADQNADPVNQAMLSFLGVIRKFNVSLWFMSPTRMNLAPKIRQFIDDPVKAGNLDNLWFKDLPRIKKMISVSNLDMKPHQYIVIQHGSEHKGRFLYIPQTSWLTKVDELKNGDYGYDDEASATFTYSETPDFDHQALLDRTSGQRKSDMPAMLREYFDMLDAGEFSKKKSGGVEADDQVSRVMRARENKIPWKTIEAYEGTHKNTLRSRIERFSLEKQISGIKNDDEPHEGGTT